jgi:hypothetical protein
MILVLLGGCGFKRSELMEYLKEVLSVCGESIVMEMVWLNKTESAASGKEDNYQLIIKSGSVTLDHECLIPIIEKFGMKMKKQGGLWIFSKKE